MKSLLKYFLLTSMLLLGGCNHLASIKGLGAMKHQRFRFAQSDLSFFINTPCVPKKYFFEISATEIEEKDEELMISDFSFYFSLAQTFGYFTVAYKNLSPLSECLVCTSSYRYLMNQVLRL